MIYLNIVAISRSNQYRLKLARIESAQPDAGIHEPLVSTVTNHNELLRTINKLKDNEAFDDLQQATEYAIGLKLFSKVVIKK